jgi:DNA repair protein RecO (recombination protein O)
MNWEDEGFLLSKKKFRENANIISVFSSKKGKVTGIVYGGNSRKIRNYLQLSNKIFISYNSKNQNRMGYFKTELIKPISPFYFNDKERTSALTSLCSLLNSLLPEEQPNKRIYQIFDDLLNSLNFDNWIILYIFFEISLIKELGYDVNLSIYRDKKDNNSDTKKINIDGYIYEVPNYLMHKNVPENITNILIKKSLYFTRNIIVNKFYLPNNFIFPKSRVILENYFN